VITSVTQNIFPPTNKLSLHAPKKLKDLMTFSNVRFRVEKSLIRL